MTVPTVQEELDRKSVETLAWLINALEFGKITIHQFSTGVDAVWGVAGGLSPPVYDLVNASREMTKVKPQFLKRIFRSEEADQTATVQWVVDTDTVTLTRREGHLVVYGKSLELGSVADAKAHFEKLSAYFLSKGYIEL